MLWESYALEHILIRGEVAPHLFPKLYYAPCQKARFTFSRQINLLCPEVKGPGICHCLLMLDFLDILAGAGNSSSKDTVVQVEPNGHSPPSIVHSPSSGVEKRPIPHVPTFRSCPPQVPWTAPATSWVFHMLEPSRSPTSAILL